MPHIIHYHQECEASSPFSSHIGFLLLCFRQSYGLAFISLLLIYFSFPYDKCRNISLILFPAKSKHSHSTHSTTLPIGRSDRINFALVINFLIIKTFCIACIRAKAITRNKYRLHAHKRRATMLKLQTQSEERSAADFYEKNKLIEKIF